MRRIYLYIVLVIVAAGCRQKYVLPGGSPATGYLVIDGVINSGQGATLLRLTRTLGLVDSVAYRYETGANVRVEGEDNSNHLLTEQSDGIYNSPQLTLNGNIKYRLHVNTRDNREYITDYLPVLRTPPIDTISRELPERGLELYIDTHDPDNNTRYYRWEYEEDWEFHSAFTSELRFVFDGNGKIAGVANRDYAERALMYTCYKDARSTGILIGTSAKLERDTIHLPIMFIPRGSWKVSVLYSIFVRQYALSRGGFEYLQRMKKNTEQVGSLFDAQPSELVSNINCVTNPDEPVIGYIDIADAQEKRIFVKRSEVDPWRYSSGCWLEAVINNPDTLALYSEWIPTSVAEENVAGGIKKVFLSLATCVDCRLRGTNNKPSFWP